MLFRLIDFSWRSSDSCSWSRRTAAGSRLVELLIKLEGSESSSSFGAP